MKHHISPYRIYVLIFLWLLITAEIIWSWKKDKAYEIKETLSNLVIFAGFQFSKYVFAAYQFSVVRPGNTFLVRPVVRKRVVVIK